MTELTKREKKRSGPKKARRGLSIDHELIARAEAARPLARTNFSHYVRDLVERDLAGGDSPDPVLDQRILVSLLQRLDPLAAEEIDRALQRRPDLDQRRVLQQFLAAYLRGIRPHSDVLEESSVPIDPVLERAATALAALAERGKSPSL